MAPLLLLRLVALLAHRLPLPAALALPRPLPQPLAALRLLRLPQPLGLRPPLRVTRLLLVLPRKYTTIFNETRLLI